jgi:hypothetical protein
VDKSSKLPTKLSKVSHRGDMKKAIRSSPPGGEVVSIVNVIFTVLKVFGLNNLERLSTQGRKLISSLDRTVSHWKAGSLASGEDGWMKFAKYKFAAFFHYHTEQFDEGPERPFDPLRFADLPGKLVSGMAGQFVEKKLLRSNSRSEFLATVLQIKKGCPRPNKEMIKKQLDKTFKALTTVRPTPDEPILPNGQTIRHSRIVEELKRTVRNVFRGKRYTDNHRYQPFSPSTSASFSQPRKSGGSSEDIRRFLHSGGVQTEHRVTLESRQLNDEIEEIGLGSRAYYRVNNELLIGEYADAYEKLLRNAEFELPDCKPVGLAESLKIRVITKGPAYTNFVLKPLQKFMWTTLKDHPTFQLIGTPVTTDIIRKKMGVLGVGEMWNSGDYSAATDNLAPWVSETIANEIAKVIGLTSTERELFIRALTGHVIHHNGESKIQMWGQLMGSVVSFPVLCIANAALTRLAMEYGRGRRVKLHTLPLLINGDDVVARMNMPQYQVWKSVTKYSGLEPSVGKTFLSTEFLQINSTNFQYVDGSFIRTDFLNLGLLYGMKRSGEKIGADAVADDTMDGSLGTRHAELLSFAPPHLWVRIHKIFLNFHWEILENVHVPWYVPESWGGVGLRMVVQDHEREVDPDDGLSKLTVSYPEYGPTKADLAVAKKILDEPTLYPIQRIPSAASWLTHKVVMKRLPDLVYGVPNDKQAANFQRLYGNLAVDVFFGEEAIFEEKKTSRAVPVLRRNEQLWRKAFKSPNRPKPMSHGRLFQTSPDVGYLHILTDEEVDFL